MSSVPLREFLFQLCICSEKAACIARYIRLMQTDFGSIIQEKQLDENHQHLDADYKTLADVIIQEVIKRDLRKLYPPLGNRIYGEEDGSLKLQSSNEKILIDVNGTEDDILALLKKLFNQKSTQSIQALAGILAHSFNASLPERCKDSFEQISPDTRLDLSNIGIWIDPIDGTQQYINGTDGIVDVRTGITQDGLPTAMVLIGCFDVSNGQAVIGVINRPFHQKIDQHRWQSLIYWGTALSDAKHNNLPQGAQHPTERVLTFGSVNISTFKTLLPGWIKLEVSACGNKLLSVALKQANVFLVTRSAAYNWDLCAAHAILQSIDGHILDLRRVLDYYREHPNLNHLDFSQFSILYNNIQPNKFVPADFACPPFIAFSNPQDLIDTLHELVTQNILLE